MMRLLFSLLCLILSSQLTAQQDSLSLFPWCKGDTLILITSDKTEFPATTMTTTYPQISHSPSVLLAFEQYGLYGFKDQLGEIIISPNSEEVGTFQEGFVWTKLDHKRYLYLNKKGEPLLNYTFDRCFDFQDGVAKVLDFNESKGYEGYGFLDTLGNIVVPLIYEQAFDFVSGYALVKDEQGWWLINKKGEKIIGPNTYLVAQGTIFSCRQ